MTDEEIQAAYDETVTPPYEHACWLAFARRIAEIERELNKLFGSKLYELFTACNIARRVGRDLLEEMATRLDADIAGVRAQLATRPPS